VVPTSGSKRRSECLWKRHQSEFIGGVCGADDRLKIHTRKQALEWIGVRVSPGQEKEDRGQKLTPTDIAMQALAAMVLGHVPVRDMNFRPKSIYLSTMARRVLMAMIDESMVDDRDYVGNKRLEL
jgi:DNA-directed RNA polymerase III subunit RPC2